MMEENQQFCTKLVQAVKKHPCLYNYNLGDYFNKNKADEAWIDVSREVNASISICKYRWRNIRACFSRSLKSGRRNKKKPYYLNKMMHFVIPFLNPKRPPPDVVENIPIVPEKETELNLLSVRDDEDKSISSSESEIATPLRLRQATIKSRSVPMNVKKIKQHNITEGSPRKHFLLSLIEDVGRMTEDQFSYFRNRVLILIDDILSANNQSTEHYASADMDAVEMYDTSFKTTGYLKTESVESF